jgi:Fe-S-cluster containining protein
MRNEKGYCKHLTDDNLCGIYINRPADCNLSIVRAKLNMSERIFNKAHLYDCMVLAEQEELPEVVEQIRQELIKL